MVQIHIPFFAAVVHLNSLPLPQMSFFLFDLASRPASISGSLTVFGEKIRHLKKRP